MNDPSKPRHRATAAIPFRERLGLFGLCAGLLAFGAVTALTFDGPREASPSTTRWDARAMNGVADAEAPEEPPATQQAEREAQGQAYAGLEALQQVRVDGDLSGYGRAGSHFDRALARSAENVDAHVGQGMLSLALHDFEAALEWGRLALALNPYDARALAVIVDAQVELGRYDEALASAEALIERRPDQASYGRISYLRELHGDVDGAAVAMRMAAQSGPPGSEGSLWSWHRLGTLFLEQGRLGEAAEAFAQALATEPDYTPAQVGMLQVELARGEAMEAIPRMTAIAARSGAPDDLIFLGELLERAGRQAEAEARYAEARAAMQPDLDAGSDLDLMLAIFEIEYGRVSDWEALLARSRAAYDRAPSIVSADQLSWVLYHAGELEEAWGHSLEARRLGTRDAQLYHRAGRIAMGLGDAAQARTLFAQAREIRPHYTPRDGLGTPVSLR